jgi:D-glycero-alpha-D-manno-heptose-7-phosphate kinase
MRVESRAPARVDLAGGTVDIWPLYLFHPGAQTVNVAIRCYASCVVETRADRRIVLASRDQGVKESWSNLDDLSTGTSKLPLLQELVKFFEPPVGLTITTMSEVPAGAGLAGSSTLNIALCGALSHITGPQLTPRALLEIAKNVEAIVIRVPTGWQDYFPGLYGGVNSVHLRAEGVKRERLPIPVADLEERFVLCYTGQPRNSGINNWEVMKAHIDGNRRVINNLARITTIATQMREALLRNDWNSVAGLLSEEWENRKHSFKGISTPVIDRLIEGTRPHGTLAAKVCGAGGGGCVVFMVSPGSKPNVEGALTEMGGKVINFAVARAGLEVTAGPSPSRRKKS